MEPEATVPTPDVTWKVVGRTKKGLDAERARICGSPEARARRLLQFARLDLQSLPTNGWDQLRERVASIIGSPGVFDEPPALTGQAFRVEMVSWQLLIRRGLSRLAAGQEWHGLSTVEFTTLSLNPGGTLRVRHNIDIGKRIFRWSALFKHSVFRLLPSVQKHLRFCQECREPFIAVKRQTYCSARCSQAVRTRRFLKKHAGSIKARRREAYIRRQQAKYGPRVRVASHRNPNSKRDA